VQSERTLLKYTGSAAAMYSASSAEKMYQTLIASIFSLSEFQRQPPDV